MTPPADALPTHYRFADLTLDVARRRVTRHGRTIELKALDFDVLRFLAESAPNVVNADVLAEKVWGRHFVSPENLAQRVMLLRQSLSDDANQPRYIETVRNKGYRLIPLVELAPAEAPHPTPWRRELVTAAAALLLAAAADYWLIDTIRPPPLQKSVAVLPFESLSPDTGQNQELDLLLTQRVHWLVARNDFTGARGVGIKDPLNISMLDQLHKPQEVLDRSAGRTPPRAPGVRVTAATSVFGRGTSGTHTSPWVRCVRRSRNNQPSACIFGCRSWRRCANSQSSTRT